MNAGKTICIYTIGSGKGVPCTSNATDGSLYCQPHVDYLAAQQPVPRGGAVEPRGGAVSPRGGASGPRGGVAQDFPS